MPEAPGAEGWQLYFDVSPMFDREWTGIPIVAAGLAQALLERAPDATTFFFHHHLVETGAVKDALERGSGLYLERNFHAGHANAGPVPALSGHNASVGIYPSVKPVTALFTVECSIYHDISTFILPQYHTSENIRHHLRGLADDIRTNAVSFGVSQATVDDMICYLGASPERTFVLPNGVAWPWWFPIEAANFGPVEAAPYFVVVGTREPRKNLSLVWQAIQMFPEVLDAARLFVVGRKGWLQEDVDRFPGVGRRIESGRVVVTGYISNFEKYRLLRGAAATIYPSLFEGFGLPVLESLSVGTPCLASWSSSIPEVGGDACRYFDPLSAEELGLRMREVLREPARSDRAPLVDLTGRTWTAMLDRMLERLAPALAAANR